jgi:ribonuclease BN (tRNA processing enzyme)
VKVRFLGSGDAFGSGGRFQPLELASISLTPFEVVHPSGAPPFALRITGDGKVVAYSGDTEWTESLIDAARRADLFIAEALFFDKAVKYHLNLATLLGHRARLECRRLIVTHMSEDMLRRCATLEVETAEDGKVVVV